MPKIPTVAYRGEQVRTALIYKNIISFIRNFVMVVVCVCECVCVWEREREREWPRERDNRADMFDTTLRYTYSEPCFLFFASLTWAWYKIASQPEGRNSLQLVCLLSWLPTPTDWLVGSKTPFITYFSNALTFYFRCNSLSISAVPCLPKDTAASSLWKPP